jgi:hypothetical protein
MKKIGLSIIIIIASFASIFAQKKDNGIGIRLGEPMGVSYKRYLPDNRAIEVILGSAARGWSSSYYRNSFEHYSKYDAYDYRSHKVKSLVYLQARYLFQNNILIEGMPGKLDWYWGFGGLLKSAQVEYHYRNKIAPFTNYVDKKNDIDLGGEAILGMEYAFDNIPMSIFAEISLMVEFVDRPVAFRSFTGIGARYNF